MDDSALIWISICYLLVLFAIGSYFRKNQAFSNSKYIYALSLCVYCTAWTFYGSVGRSAETGFGYLGVYLGPTIIAPLMLLMLSKTIKISKFLRISSIADFISARYGKNSTIGTISTLLCVFIAIPYISIQLKALDLSYALITNSESVNLNDNFSGIFTDPALLFGMVCAIICILLGTVKAAPTDRHPGIISLVALESLFKLIAFLIGALFILFYLNDGVSDIFLNYNNSLLDKELLDLKNLTDNGNSWFWITIISAIAFLILPRQFHMAVIENENIEHVKSASWMVPLYMFIISIFVLPIALAGQMEFGQDINPDNFLTKLLLSNNLDNIAVIVFIGGIAASTGMIITSLISLSIMCSNHILLPLLLILKTEKIPQLEVQLIGYRRILIFVILLASFAYYQIISINYSLVSIGLVSFVGISQLFPAYIFGLYWKLANARGIVAGLIVGIIVWAYTLPIADLCEIGIIDSGILTHGLFGFEVLRPQALFGIEDWNPVAHASFWSLSLNFLVTASVSLMTQRNPLEIAQSDIFLFPDKYVDNTSVAVLTREANFNELKNILNEVIGIRKVTAMLDSYKEENELEKFGEYADTALIQYIENQLSGSLGSASTRIILDNIVKNQPVKPDQIFKVLDQNNQLYEYSKALEEKRDELNATTAQLSEANNKLKELDVLKNEFISNVTHELRTPLTSINSLSDSLNDFELDEDERKKIIKIIKKESQRISNLINQVLDLRKLEAGAQLEVEKFNVGEMIHDVVRSFSEFQGNRKVQVLGDERHLLSDQNKVKQVIINLMANAIKFTEDDGQIKIRFWKLLDNIHIEVIDDGIGIPSPDIDHIFGRFYQSKNITKQFHKGSGLGLAISKDLVEKMYGTISVKSNRRKNTTFTVKLPDLNDV